MNTDGWMHLQPMCHFIITIGFALMQPNEGTVTILKKKGLL